MEYLNALKLQTALHLRNLEEYQRNVNKLDLPTQDLFNKTIVSLSSLIQSAEVISTLPSYLGDGSLLNLDTNIFQYKCFITCCVCHTQFGITEGEYLAHCETLQHKQNLHLCQMPAYNNNYAPMPLNAEINNGSNNSRMPRNMNRKRVRGRRAGRINRSQKRGLVQKRIKQAILHANALRVLTNDQ